MNPGWSIEGDGITGHYPDHSPGFDIGLASAPGVDVHRFDMGMFGATPPGVPPANAAEFGDELVQGFYLDPANFQPDDIFIGAADEETAGWGYGPDCLQQDPPCQILAILPAAQGRDHDVIVGDHADQAAATGQDPVNPASGELVHHHVDLAFESLGVPFVHRRVYRSRLDFDGPHGYGWDHSNNRRLIQAGSAFCGAEVHYSTGDGSVIRFPEGDTTETLIDAARGVWEFHTTYRSPPGVRLSLSKHGYRSFLSVPGGHGGPDAVPFIQQTWTMTEPSGLVSVFDDFGLLARSETATGFGQDFVWEPSPRGDQYRLAAVIDAEGRVIEYHYDADGRLVLVEEPETGLHATYVYDGNDLVQATDAMGRPELYGYDGGHPDETGGYLAEPALIAGCRQACSSIPNWCGQAGACADIATRGPEQCRASCDHCIGTCADGCAGYCRDGTDTTPGCVGDDYGGCGRACQDLCATPEVRQGLCEAAFDGRGAADPEAETPADKCAGCDDRVQSVCEASCANFIFCLGQIGDSEPNDMMGVTAAQADAAACAATYGFSEGLEHLLLDVVNAAATAIVGTGEAIWCGFTAVAAAFCWVFSYFFDCEPDVNCDFNNAADQLEYACNNSCYTCGADGDNCSADSCIPAGRRCEEECASGFMGDVTSNSCGYPAGFGCTTVVWAPCERECARSCLDQCAVGCESDCGNACADVCDPEACVEACDDVDYVDLCERGCYQGCIDAGHEAAGGTPKYGYPRDLNHNLVSIRTLDESGSEVEYLHNDYGSDLGAPSFDAVISQLNGGFPIAFEYHDLVTEAAEAPPLPWSPGRPIALIVEPLSRYESVDICPASCGTGEAPPWSFGDEPLILRLSKERSPSPPPAIARTFGPRVGPIKASGAGPSRTPGFEPGDVEPGCAVDALPGKPLRGRGPTAPGAKPAQATVVTDAYGVRWTFYYDETGRTLRTVNHGTGQVWSYSYNALGDLEGVESPLGDRRCQTWNSDGYVTDEIRFPVPGAPGDASPIRQRFHYTGHPVRLVEVSDPRDPRRSLATFSWDDQGNLVSRTEATGEVTTFTPSPWGPPERIVDASGAVTTFTYDPSAGVASTVTVDADGPSPVTMSLVSDRAGRPISAVSPLGEVLTWTWNGGRLESMQRDADGLIEETTLGYNPDGQVSRIVKGEQRIDVLFDLLGESRVTTAYALDGSAADQVTCRRFGPGGRLLEQVLPEGNRIRYEHDAGGRITRAIAGSFGGGDAWDDECAASYSGGSGIGATELQSLEYDLGGRPTLVRDGRGVATTLRHDGFHRAIEATDSLGAVHRVGHDALGNVLWTASYAPGAAPTYRPPTRGDPGLLQASVSTYDLAGRLERADRWHFDATGADVGDGHAVTTYTYDPANRRILVTDDAGGVTEQRVDGAGRPASTTLPTGDVITIQRLDAGRTVRRQWTAPTADGLRSELTRLTAWGAVDRVETDDAGGLAVTGQWFYDEQRRPILQIGAGGRQTTIAYDALGRTLTTVRDDGSAQEAVTFGWDRNSRLASRASDAGGVVATTSYLYDALDRVTHLARPAGIAEDYTYLGGSSLVDTVLDGRGVLFDNDYTDTGRLSRILAIPPVGETIARDFTRDDLGRLVEARDSGASFALPDDDVVTFREWDSLSNRTAEWDTVLDELVQHTHDGHGRPVSSDLGGLSVTRAFDGIGRLASVALGVETVASFAYSGLGGPTSRVYGSGVQTTFEYDDLGRLRHLLDAGAGDLAEWRWEIPLDGTPRLAGLRRGGANEVASLFSVDAGGRVASEDHGLAGLEGLTLDPKAPHAAAEGAIAPYLGTSVATRSYLLDGRHNWLARDADDAALDAVTTRDELDAYSQFGGQIATYDGRGALLGLSGNPGDETFVWNAIGDLVEHTTPTSDHRFSYDALGRLVKEEDLVTGETTRHGYDGLQRTFTETPDGDVATTVHGGLDEPLVREAKGSRYFYHQDRLGSVYLITSLAGVRVEHYDYTAFGDVALTTPAGAPLAASLIDNRIGFQGQLFDPTGLVHMRARWYRPTWGRFLDPDPIGLLGGSNLYAFVLGAPLSFMDPMGWSARDAAWNRQATDYRMPWHDAVNLAPVNLGLDPGFALMHGLQGLAQNPPIIKAWSDASADMGAAYRASKENDFQGVAQSAFRFQDHLKQMQGETILSTGLPAQAARGLWGAFRGLRAGQGAAGDVAVFLNQAPPGQVARVSDVSVFERTVTNSFPENAQFARVMELKYARSFWHGKGRLGGGDEVFITAAEDLEGISTVSTAQQRLSMFRDEAGTVPSLRGDAMITFKLRNPETAGLSTPVETMWAPRGYGFAGQGRTAGGAREWIVPNFTRAELQELGAYDIEIFLLTGP